MARKKAPNGSGMQPRWRPDINLWEARYIAGINPATGKEKRKSVYAKTKTECAKKLREATAAVDKGTYLEPEKMRISEWMQKWLDTYCKVKPRTKETYESAITSSIIPALGHFRICELKPAHIQDYINSLEAHGLGAHTIREYYCRINQAMKKAKQLRMIAENPCEPCTCPKIVKKEMRYMDSDNLKAFLRAAHGHPLERAYQVAIFTGMRQAELLGLCWDAIDLDKGIITIKRQMQRIAGVDTLVNTTKNNKERSYPLPAFVVDVLREQQRWQRKQRLAAGSGWNNPDNLVFTNAIGEGIKARTLYNNYKALLKAAGLDENLRYHDLRHSYAVHAIENGDDYKTVQQVLGHHSSSFTADVYGHLTEAALTASASRRNEAIKELYRDDKETASDTSESC